MPNIPNPLPPVEFLRECFRLDMETGHLFWLVRPRDHFKDCWHWKQWPDRHAGKRADRAASKGYYRVRITIDGELRTYAAHRIIWKMVHDREPGLEVDHIDRNPSNNRPDNLRECTHAENKQNVGRYANNTSGFRGVSWVKRENKWRAAIKKNGRLYRLGDHQTPEEAYAAYLDAKRRLHTFNPVVEVEVL